MGAGFIYEIDRTRFGRLWWLPSNGYGNGLDDVGWAPIVDVIPSAVEPILQALLEEGVAAYAVPLGRGGTPRIHRVYRLWIGTSRYNAAEDTLMKLLPELDQRAGGPVVR